MQVIGNKLHNEDTLVEQSLSCRSKPSWSCWSFSWETHFQVDDNIFQQKHGMAKVNSLSHTISNILMEHFEKLTLDSPQYKPSLWLQYVDDTFVVWPHGLKQLQNFLSQLNSLRPSIQFIMEIESDSVIAFLDVLVIRKEMTLATKVFRKPTHTGQYLNVNSNHPPHVKRSLIQSSQYSFHHMPRMTRSV